MTLHTNHNGVWREAEAWTNHNGTWKKAEVWTNHNGVWKVVAGALAVSGGSTSVWGEDGMYGSGFVTVVTTHAVAGTVTGGTAPYTYVWEYVSGSPASPTNPNAASTAFSRGLPNEGRHITAYGTYRCKITDNTGAVIYGPNCLVETIHHDYSQPL